MKVLVITHNNNEKSGANRSLLSLLAIWRNKFEISAVVNHTSGNLPDVLNSMGITVIRKRYGWQYASKRDSLIRQVAVIVRELFNNINALCRMLVNLDADICKNTSIIYSNTSVIVYGAILSKRYNIPHIWHFREFGEEDFGFLKLLPDRIQMALYRNANAIICISKSLKQKYMDQLSNIHVIYNGFDIDSYVSNRQYKGTTQFNILIAGQINEAKGQSQAIEAVERLNNMGLCVHLYIAGSGDWNYLEQSLKCCDHADHIHVLGQVSDLYSLRSKMHLAVICSKAEAFGRVTIESMLHSLPVIGADCGANSELIEDCKTGMLYKYGDVDDLVEKVLLLLNDDELREQIGRNGMEFARQFTIERTSNEIEKLFLEIRNK